MSSARKPSPQRPVEQTLPKPTRPKPAKMEKLYYRPAEVQTLLGIKTTKFYALVKAGQLEIKKLGRATIVPAESLQKFAAQLDQ